MAAAASDDGNLSVAMPYRGASDLLIRPYILRSSWSFCILERGSIDGAEEIKLKQSCVCKLTAAIKTARRKVPATARRLRILKGIMCLITDLGAVGTGNVVRLVLAMYVVWCGRREVKGGQKSKSSRGFLHAFFFLS